MRGDAPAGKAETLGATWEAELGSSGTVEVHPDYSAFGVVRGEVLAGSTP